ncbi:uncharacterized protein LOC111644064 [Copidosoma floridanum]|uniref:uncharacterized protein LOC111644064 n=1 Tax=Copidosoma floridanum TaxID=29053 RepID=UPI000C6FB6A1|nr:uncharacterized protein LOC111644064 [Copidosoma floridanum]
MSGQAVDFFRPWNNADKKVDGSSPGVDEYEDGVAGKGPKLNPEEDFDSESDDSSLAGSSSSYNSIDSEQSIDGPLRHRRHRRSTKPMVVGAAPVVCQEVGLPRVYPAFAQPGIWDPLGLRLEEAVYFNGIAAEVDRIHQQEFAAKQIKKTRPKNFNCNYCPAAFSNNGQLKGHLRTHTDKKPQDVKLTQ